MGIRKTEAGQGGKKGHSNMTHWDYTEWIKSKMKKKRRQQDREIIGEQE